MGWSRDRSKRRKAGEKVESGAKNILESGTGSVRSRISQEQVPSGAGAVRSSQEQSGAVAVSVKSMISQEQN